MSRVVKALREMLTRGAQIKSLEERVTVAERKPPKKRKPHPVEHVTAGAA